MVKCAKRLRGEITVPGDKSISHRAIMFGSIAKGTTVIKGFLNSADCLSTISCFEKAGIEIERNNTDVIVKGKGLRGLKSSKDDLYVGNSGTTMRLISGIFAGQDFSVVLDGDDSIRKRPMKRIIDPLTLMGANIASNNGLCPLKISKGKLHGIDYTLPVASAQVKSCILLAGLYAQGETKVTEIAPSRDHTERMLKGFGADIKVIQKTSCITSKNELTGTVVEVPGDISSAAYFIAAALIHPNAEILIKNVNINSTRAGIIKVAKAMGGNIELLNKRTTGGEEVCDLFVKSSSLSGTVVEGDIIPTLIDELPIIAVMAAFATGKTIIRDACELKNKESDRIKTVSRGLISMGCEVNPKDDGMEIIGGCSLKGAKIITEDDHRIAMSFSVPALIIPGISLDNPGCVNISFADFYDIINSVCEY